MHASSACSLHTFVRRHHSTRCAECQRSVVCRGYIIKGRPAAARQPCGESGELTGSQGQMLPRPEQATGDWRPPPCWATHLLDVTSTTALSPGGSGAAPATAAASCPCQEPRGLHCCHSPCHWPALPRQTFTGTCMKHTTLIMCQGTCELSLQVHGGLTAAWAGLGQCARAMEGIAGHS